MFEKSSFWNTQRMLERGLDVGIRRREVIADNIANVDVPNFKRSEVVFESMLKRAVEAEGARRERQEFPALVRHERHIPFSRPVDWEGIRPRQMTDYLTTMRQDGNNVDMEKEMILATENQMRYNLMAQHVNHNFKKLNIVLRPA